MTKPARRARPEAEASSARPVVAAKVCEQCNESKPASSFLPSAFTPDKLTDRCKSCVLANGRRDLAELDAKKAGRQAKVDAGSKKCRTCKTEKPLAAFARHALSADGLRRDCKACVAEGKVAKKPQSRKPRKRQTDDQKAKATAQTKAWRKAHKGATGARDVLKQALKAGIIARPSRCQIRGCTATATDAHHPSYAPEHRLVVLWTCRSHHRLLHAGEQLLPIKGLPVKLAGIPEELQ